MDLMKREKGFTLMEMIIVVGIILILTGIGFSNYIFSIAKSRDTRRKSDLATISKAIQAFANDFGSYPLADSGQMVACDYNNTVLIACNWGQPMAAFINDHLVTYLGETPADPDGDQDYYYEAGADGNSFSLYAALENDQDPSYRTDLTQTCGSGVTCNYQLSDSGVSVE